MTPPRTVPELLDRRLAGEATQPLLTAYDDTTGERTELSVTTYANWVSKTGNLLVDELGLEPGDTVVLDLPSHWLVPVFLGAAWSAGLRVTTHVDTPGRLLVCGPDGLARPRAAEEVLACSLLPFAVRFADPLPDHVLDYGLMWPGQSDVFLPVALPSPDTVAWHDEAGERSHAELLEQAAATAYDDGVRLITDVHPARGAGVPALLAPLVHQGSVVLVSHADESRWASRRADERATAELRAAAQPTSE